MSTLSIVFSAIPLAGELFLFVTTRQLHTTIFAALGIATLLLGNLAALGWHGKIVIAQIVFCATLIAGVSAAIAVDGGIESPLWFFQLLVI